MAMKNYAGSRTKATRKPKVLLTSHASQMLKSRGITQAALLKALTSGTSHVDNKTGREVVRAGDLRLVVTREANTITVVTVVNAKDLAA
jgi:hypothetical protein